MTEWVIENTLYAALLAGVVCLVTHLKRLSPAARHALWLLVLLKLVTPPVVSWPWRAPDLHLSLRAVSEVFLETATNTAAGKATLATEAGTSLFVDPQLDGEPAAWPPAATVLEVPQAGITLPVEAASLPVPPLEAPRSRFSPGVLAIGLWAAGALLLSAIEARRIVRLRRMISRGRPAPRQIAVMVEEISRRFGLRAPPPAVVACTSSPLVACIGRPRLVLPAAMLPHASASAWRAVIAHELAHLKRRDHWVAWLELAAGIFWWWNPLFWHTRRELHDSAELACDAWVVWALPRSRRDYAETLIDVCEMVSEGRAPLLSRGMGSVARKAFFQRRLSMILLERVPPKMHHRGLFSLGLAALLVLPGLSRGQDPATGAEVSPPRAEPAEPGNVPQPVKPLQPAEAAEPEDPAEPIAPPQPAQPPRPARRVRAVEPIQPIESILEGKIPPDVDNPLAEIFPPEEEPPAPTPRRAPRPRGPQWTKNAGGHAVGVPPPMAGGMAGPGSLFGGSGPEPGHQDAQEHRLLDLERRLLELQAELMRLRDDGNASNRRGGPAPYPETGMGRAPVVRGSRESTVRRGPPPTTIAPPPGPGGAPGALTQPRLPEITDLPGLPGVPGALGPSGLPGRPAIAAPPAAPGPGGEVFRRRHKLTPAKADALAQFIEENVDAGVRVEAKGDVITVTADAEAHAAIEGFISLLKKQKPAAN